ncbi:diguanylate cyclase domain-containing protein [Vibrio tubiashii]|uniref:GGDEF domain-containing protein n=1 Tax=Vibrio tubiashii TaxID=29498 RepID=UPI003CE4B1D2
MALPKFLLRTLRPYVILLVIGIIYAAYHQFQKSEKNAYSQSFANVKTASSLISSQVEAAVSKLYILDDATSLSEFDATAKRILEHTPSYIDIISVNSETGQYRSSILAATPSERTTHLVWHPLDQVSPHVYVSSIYEKQPRKWVFAVKFIQQNSNEIWIEFDLKSTTQSLLGLRTLDCGYLFVVDNTNGRLVFHPTPHRIGTKSISYRAGIDEKINSGHLFGKHEYFYKGHLKLSVFDGNNPYNWVFISGTNRSDVLAATHQFALTAIVIISLLLLAVIVNYLIYQLNSHLAELNTKVQLADFKHCLRDILNRFCHHKGIQICFYDADYGHFTTIDYHGNSHIVLHDSELAKRFTPSSMSYKGRRYVDPLAKRLQINSRHYTLPLFDRDNLISVIYIKATFPGFHSVLRMIRDYSEVALSNLLIHKRLRSKDVMTHLDNKLTLREQMESHIDGEHIYMAMLDIDHFKRINDQHGHLCGDQVIIHTAELMKKCFPKPKALSLARYSGEEFSLLFKANDENDAYEQCELLRYMVEQSKVVFDDVPVKYSISIGITSMKGNQNMTIGRADKALYQAKGLGRNQVVLNTFD